MVTVQMTLEGHLVKRVDQMAQKLHTSRSAFTREALKEAIRRYQTLELERKHRSGYQKHPAGKGEFDLWEDEHAWGQA